MVDQFDVVVVGAGPGGLSAAACLADVGLRVLVVERHDRVGGRASTVEVDGFRVPAGAPAFELDGPLHHLLERFGAPYEVRVPDTMLALRLGKRQVDISSPTALHAVDRVLRAVGPRLLRRMQRRDPLQQLMIADYLHRLSRRSRIRKTLRNVIAGIYASNLDEVPAQLALRYFVEKGAFRRIGYPPGGGVAVWERMAGAVTARGGAIWLNASAELIHTVDGRVTGVTVQRGDASIDVVCRAIISDAGPSATTELLDDGALDDDWVRMVHTKDRPAPMIVIEMASRRRLFEPAAGIFFADTERLSSVGHLTEVCPELAPPGWFLYVAYGVPVPALGDYDPDHEMRLVLDELEAVVDGFGDVRILRARIATGADAPVRAPTGKELPWRTPVERLYLVGDAVREPGDSGMQACVRVAQTVATVVAETLSRAEG